MSKYRIVKVLTVIAISIMLLNMDYDNLDWKNWMTFGFVGVIIVSYFRQSPETKESE